MLPDAPRDTSALAHPADLRAYVDYLRDLGVYDLIARDPVVTDEAVAQWAAEHLQKQGTPEAAPARSATSTVRTAASASSPAAAGATSRPSVAAGSAATSRPAQPFAPPSPAATSPRAPQPSPFERAQQRRPDLQPAASRAAGPAIQITPPVAANSPSTTPAEPQPLPPAFAPPDMPAPKPFNDLAPLPTVRIAPAEKPAALQAIRADIGDCTRCPLAYAGRHTIVFGDGDPGARLMFVGEGPGADEDEQGIPFVGKAGQLLNNMIGAMGLKREQVYIANVVKCRPPKNRVPEPVEANTCSHFLLRQIDVVRPEVIVALGGTAATYLLGVKQSLTSLRGQWFNVRGAKCAVTYHPAFLLRDPRQKGEAWKDLQRVMTELKLQQPARA